MLQSQAEPQPKPPTLLLSTAQTQVIRAKQFKQLYGLINQQKKKDISTRIKNYYGKNFPILYRPQYKFYQQWESRQFAEIQNDNLLQQLGPVYTLFSIITLVACVFAVWTISIERYFNTQAVSSTIPIYHILIGINISDIVIKYYLKYIELQHLVDVQFIFTTFYRNFLLLTYSFVMIFIAPQQSFMYAIQIVIIYLLYTKAAQIYGFIKVMQFCLQYENHVKIIDLLLNIFIQAHLFAVVLFTSSKIDPNENWVSSAGLENSTYFVKYVNAIYFACTTMLTIGYGDITPLSVGEKLVTIVIEIVGVIAFGYLLNEMGHTLSKMRKQSQIMERDLQTISKISKYYNLEPKLQNKARNFILNNQRKNQSLEIDDENKLLMKLNEDLRHQINLQNSLNIVKSCIFYLCHWSKNMQSEIAQRLQKRMFAPNEKVMSTNGQDRVYIIKKGRVDLYLNRYGANQQHKKLLKIIDTQLNGQVSDNIFGYTTVFSNRPVRLQGIAKDFTSTYSVNRGQFMQCINKNIHDFEYYHEIKSRVDQSTFSQEWEAPAIRNIREHYDPSSIIIIKKYRKKMEKSQNSHNKVFKRRMKKKYKLVQGLFNKNRNAAEEVNQFAQKTIQFTARFIPYQDELVQSKGSEEDISSDDIVSMNSEQKSHRLALEKRKTFTRLVQQNQNKKVISSKFQAGKEYLNFFRRNNISTVLFNLQKLNFIEKRLNGSEKQNNIITSHNIET